MSPVFRPSMTLLAILQATISGQKIENGGVIFLDAQNQRWVQEHNAYRKDLLPEGYGDASNMNLLVWNHKIALSAQAWVNELKRRTNCQMEHPGADRKYAYGQNLAWQWKTHWPSDRQQIEQSMITDAMRRWGTDEIPALMREVENKGATGTNFAHGILSFDHYTQMIQSDTKEIGCAYAECHAEHGGTWGVSRVTACEYDPPGNTNLSGTLGFERWYTRGPPCSKCNARSQSCQHEFFCLDKNKLDRAAGAYQLDTSASVAALDKAPAKAKSVRAPAPAKVKASRAPSPVVAPVAAPTYTAPVAAPTYTAPAPCPESAPAPTTTVETIAGEGHALC